MKVTREDFTFDNIVNLFSTATYNSNWLSAYSEKPKHDYECREEKWAWSWIEGSYVVFTDWYAEGENNRNEDAPKILTVEIGDDQNCSSLDFHITMQQAIDTLNWALSNAEYKNSISNSVQMWLNNDNSFDVCVADSIVQAIMFGDEIYG